MPTITPTNKIAKDLANKRIFEVMHFVVTNNIQGIPDDTHFLKSIGYNSTKNLHLIRTGVQSFQVEHIQNVCTVYGISADFLLNENCHKMFADLGKESPMFRLKVAAKELEILLKELE